ncbi:MAG: YcxB family protein [Oscillospiraceae bacterium]
MDEQNTTQVIQPLHETTTTYTVYELVRYMKYGFLHSAAMFLTCLLIIYWGGFLIVHISQGKSVFAAIEAVVTVYSIVMLIRSLTWGCKKRAEKSDLLNKEMTFKFYDSYFTADNDRNHAEIEYSKIEKIHETDTNYYIMMSANDGMIVQKMNCTPELMTFLRRLELKDETNIQRMLRAESEQNGGHDNK